MRYLITLLILAVGLCGCTEHNTVDDRLKEAEELMFERPDSSLAILQSMAGSTDMMDNSDKALYALLLTQARARNYIDEKDDSLINCAIEHYSATGDNRHLAWSYLYAGDIHRNSGNDSVAIYLINKAGKTADGVKDSLLHFYTNYYLGNMLKDTPPYGQCIPYLDRALTCATAMNDTSRILPCLNEIASANLLMGKYESARTILTDALAYMSNGKSQYAAVICKKMALAYYAEQNYADALTYIDRAIDNIPAIRNYGDAPSLYALKVSTLMHIGMPDSAEVYIRKSTDASMPALTAIYEKNMSELEENRGNYRKALSHMKKYAEQKDSIAATRLNEKVTELQNRYDMAELSLAKNDAEIKAQKMGIVLCGVIIIGLVATLLLVKIIERKKRKILEIENARDTLVMETVNNVWDKANAVIDTQRARTDRLAKYFMDMDEVVMKIRSLQKLSNAEIDGNGGLDTLSDNEISHLVQVVNQYSDGFVDNLKADYPALSKSDIAICCMIKLGLKNRDICLLLGINDQSLRKRKYRIRTNRLKINESLDDWLKSKEHLKGK